MSLIDSLTPKNTEEIKAGLFIQEYRSGKYKQVEPLAWNGKFRWKEQMATVFSIRTFLTLAIILFIVYGYLHDVKVYKEFYENVQENPQAFCFDLENALANNNKMPNPDFPSNVNFGLESYGRGADSLPSNVG